MLCMARSFPGSVLWELSLLRWEHLGIMNMLVGFLAEESLSFIDRMPFASLGALLPSFRLCTYEFSSPIAEEQPLHAEMLQNRLGQEAKSSFSVRVCSDCSKITGPPARTVRAGLTPSQGREQGTWDPPQAPLCTGCTG